MDHKNIFYLFTVTVTSRPSPINTGFPRYSWGTHPANNNTEHEDTVNTESNAGTLLRRQFQPKSKNIEPCLSDKKAHE